MEIFLAFKVLFLVNNVESRLLPLGGSGLQISRLLGLSKDRNADIGFESSKGPCQATIHHFLDLGTEIAQIVVLQKKHKTTMTLSSYISFLGIWYCLKE